MSAQTPPQQPKFGRLRNALWPVHRYELKKLLPMLLIFFLVSFDYNVLRMVKDTLVVTAKASGAEVIPFIKVWVMFPCSILLTFIFTRLSNRFQIEKVFYVMLSIFLGYFFLFVTVLYPARHFLHPYEMADAMQAALPVGFKGFVAMFRNWTFTTFYVMAELWSNIILSMLFWGFANQVSRLGEAKRFYGLFGIGANFSGVAAGQASILIVSHGFDPAIPFGADAWEQQMMMLIGLVLLAGVGAMCIFRWFNQSVLTDARFYDPNELHDDKKPEKAKLSVRESFSYLVSSRYMMYLALVVLSYNLVINLVEVVWKDQVRELYPNSSDYHLYMSHVTSITGVLATLAALFISGNSIRKFGWTFTAAITPVILLVTSIGFFGFFFAKGNMDAMIVEFFGATPLAIVVLFGTTQNILSRAAKYTVFDATKEMAFVPLSTADQWKGKPAVDGICSRLGKSGGSVIHQGLLVSFQTISKCVPFVAYFLFAILSIWTMAIFALGKRFNALTQPSRKAPATASTSGMTEQVVPS